MTGCKVLMYLSNVSIHSAVKDSANIIYAIVSATKVLTQFAVPNSSLARVKVYIEVEISFRIQGHSWIE